MMRCVRPQKAFFRSFVSFVPPTTKETFSIYTQHISFVSFVSFVASGRIRAFWVGKTPSTKETKECTITLEYERKNWKPHGRLLQRTAGRPLPEVFLTRSSTTRPASTSF